MLSDNVKKKDKMFSMRCDDEFKDFMRKLSNHVGLTGRTSDMVRRAVANLAVSTGLMNEKESNKYR